MDQQDSNETEHTSPPPRDGIVFRITTTWVALLLIEFVVFAAISETQYKWHTAIAAATFLLGILVFFIMDDEWVKSLRRRSTVAAVVAVGGCCLFCWPFVIPTVRHGLTPQHLLFLAAGIVLMLSLALFYLIKSRST